MSIYRTANYFLHWRFPTSVERLAAVIPDNEYGKIAIDMDTNSVFLRLASSWVLLSSSGAPSGVAQLDFNSGNKVAEVVVTGVPSALLTSKVFTELRIEATASHSIDDLEVDPIRVSARSLVAGIGFTLRGEMDNAQANGLYNVNWSLLN